MTEAEIIAALTEKAKQVSGGHFTICRFGGKWRVGFLTPNERCDICDLHEGATFQEAAEKALAEGALIHREIWNYCACYAEAVKNGLEDFVQWNELFDSEPKGSA